MSDLTYKVLNTDGTITVYDKAAEIDSQLTDVMHKISTECFTHATCSPWANGAVATGDFNNASPELNHPGVVQLLSHATNANSGYYLLLYVSSLKLEGGEKTTLIFKTAALEGATIRMGFLDTASITDVTDGCYFEITKVGEVEGVAVGKTANAATRSTTASNFGLAANTWYRFVCELNANASLVTFKLYADDSETLLWSDTLATNIPTSYTGNGIIATLLSPSISTVIASIDYIDIVMPNARRV